MRAVFGKLTYSSLRGRIADEIQDAILTGTLPKGERLVERNLASQFATSLTAVREALIELDAKGFVTKKPNCATYVIKFSPEAADQVFAFRRVVETHAVEEAARHVKPAHLELLGKANRDLLQAAKEGDARSYLQRDLALHELVWQAANNEYFEIALKRVVGPFFAFTAIRLGLRQAFDLVQDAGYHLAFVDPICSHDPVAARNAYLRALDEWSAQTTDVLGTNQVQS